MRKSLVVYYSHDGNTRYIAERIASAVDADLAEIRPQDSRRRRGLWKYLWGGMAAMMGREPPLFPLEKNPLDYDILFLGTPVWAGRCTPAMRSFLSGTPLADKKVALFCCYGGRKGKVFSTLRSRLTGCTILAEQDFHEPLRRPNDNGSLAAEWAKLVLESAG